MRHRILHVSDLHIHDPEGSDEHLSNSYYEEYVRSLANKVLEVMDHKPVNCIVATGDFVNEGNVANFDHAELVMRRLAGEVGVDPSAGVVVCAGNHDSIRGEDKAGQSDKARSSYSGFASRFCNGSPTKEFGPRALVCQPSDGVHYLAIDATLGCRGEDRPGDLSAEEVDEIMSWVVHDLQEDELLVVATHFILWAGPKILPPSDEPDWHSRHVWQEGASLGARIASYRVHSPGRTLWLCGDIHTRSAGVSQGLPFIAVGRLGCRLRRSDSPVPRQVGVLDLDAGAEHVQMWTITHMPDAHRSDMSIHNWEAVRGEVGLPKIFRRPRSVETSVDSAPVSRAPHAAELALGEGEDIPVPLDGADGAPPPEVLSDELQSRIMETIADNRLYHLGRFETGVQWESLSWVCMGPLFNAKGILPFMIKEMAGWLAKKLGAEDVDLRQEAVLLGVDCWGAALAAQLSVATGATNFCVAARGRGESYTQFEGITPDIVEAIGEARIVVPVCDVIATGRSIQFVQEQVVRHMNSEVRNGVRWVALSVICDRLGQLPRCCDFLAAHGTACGDLPMLILSSERLPDKTVLPPSISFIRRGPDAE